MKIKLPVPQRIIVLTLGAVFYVFRQYSNAQNSAADRIRDRCETFLTIPPAEITLKEGQSIVIALNSQDVSHGLKFKELNLTIDAKKGQTGEVNFTPTQNRRDVHRAVFGLLRIGTWLDEDGHACDGVSMLPAHQVTVLPPRKVL